MYDEPGHAEIYDDGKETSSRYAETVIDIAIPVEYRYTKFSNITISVTTLNDYSTLSLCEVEVFSGKLFFDDYIYKEVMIFLQERPHVI